MEEITIKISKACGEPGYFYDIFTFDAIDETVNEQGSDEGGLCTGSMKSAIDMACELAKSLIINKHKQKL